VILIVGSFALSVLDQEVDDMNVCRRAVRHYRVKNTDAGGCYVATKKLFNTVVDLISHYKSRLTFLYEHTIEKITMTVVTQGIQRRAVVPKLFRMAALLLNQDFPKAPSVKF